MQEKTTFTSQEKNKLRIGFLVNPYAGIGGPAALKGSDSEAARVLLESGKVAMHASKRVDQFLKHLNVSPEMELISAPGIMGASFLQNHQLAHKTLTIDIENSTTADDTKKVVNAFINNHVDLIVFVGGDGTARDVCSVIEERVPVLGVPSGVKMHSGVFAITPAAGSQVVNKVISGSIVSLMQRDVRDIDEAAFQKGIVKSRCFGSMRVPEAFHYVQSVKQGGVEVDELVLADITAEIEERMEDAEQALFILGSGSTTHFIKQELGLDATLLGIDLVLNNQLFKKDVDEPALLDAISEYQHIVPTEKQKIVLVLTLIGGQGHLIGRGNQQLSPSVLSHIDKGNVWVVATKSKLEQLNGGALIVDSGDEKLDALWQGLIPVITGFHDEVLVRISNGVYVGNK